ncbi:hypothetical protein FRC04_003769 [Tulasnella sp. 424]|nr:hypothetical protein FRC04_003769 [Tulasnella sp. 424]
MSHHGGESPLQNPTQSTGTQTNQPHHGDDVISTQSAQGDDTTEHPAKFNAEGTQSNDAITAIQQYHSGEINYTVAVQTIIDTLGNDARAMRDYINMLAETDDQQRRNGD